MKKVAIVMGSDSDLGTMRKAVEKLKSMEIPAEVRILSAHRTPEACAAFARSAQAEGFGAIIAAAGKAAHLAGAIAANTLLPVIGVPVKSSTLDGLDALLSTVQMPTGIPVATVAIDGAAKDVYKRQAHLRFTQSWRRKGIFPRRIWRYSAAWRAICPGTVSYTHLPPGWWRCPGPCTGLVSGQ